MLTSILYHRVLEFWFGGHDLDKEIVSNMSELWWRKNDDTDQQVRDRFNHMYEDLIHGDLDSWKTQPASRLAMIILADQFPRNMFRGTARAFASDPLALSLCQEGIEQGMDRKLRWPQRVFFYMPMEHAESLDIQELSIKQFKNLAADVPGDEQDMVYGYIDFAIRHWEIIKRFGRFPHRNKILGRVSTEEELEFLRQPGSSF